MSYQTPSPLLLSRVAESAYWAGRHLERAQGTASLIRSHSDLIIDLPRSATPGWRPLLAVLGLEHDRGSGPEPATEEGVVFRPSADPEEPSSILSSIESLHGNLRVTRSVMPMDAAEILTELHRFADGSADLAVDRRSRSAWLGSVTRQCQTLTGVLADTMSHDDAFCFLTIGRQLERADLISRVLDVQASLLAAHPDPALEPYLDISWFAALRSVSALQAFRRTGLPPTPEAQVAFLLHDAKCPRSIESCLTEMGRWLLEIPGHVEAMGRCAAAQTRLSEAEPAELIRGGLHDFSDDLQRAIAEVHRAIDRTWFSVDAVAARGAVA